MSEPLDLDAIEARVNAATAGPWMVDGDDPTVVMKPDKPPSTWDGLLVARTRGGTGADIDSLPEYADAEFIAAAKQDIPALVARIRELEPRVLEGDWETVRDALDALPEGVQIRIANGDLAVKRTNVFGHPQWRTTRGNSYEVSEDIARDETPIEVIA